MPPINPRIAIAGLAKQTAKGSAAADPTYKFGVLDGQVFSAEVEQDYEEITLPGGASDRFAPQMNRTAIVPAASFRTRAWPQLMGQLGFGALGTVVDSGASNFTHTQTPALDLPYWTLFAQMGTGERIKLPDCKIDRLAVSWDERSPLEVEVDLMGLVPAMGHSVIGGLDLSDDPYLGPNAGTFTLEVAGAAPAAAQVKGGSVEISNNLSGVPLSKSVLPDDLVVGVQSIEGAFTVVPNDFTDWRKALTGTGAGTAVQATPVYGSYLMLALIDVNTSLSMAAPRVAFATDFPDVDPAGGFMELELAHSAVRPTDGSAAATWIVKNQIATL